MEKRTEQKALLTSVTQPINYKMMEFSSSLYKDEYLLCYDRNHFWKVKWDGSEYEMLF